MSETKTENGEFFKKIYDEIFRENPRYNRHHLKEPKYQFVLDHLPVSQGRLMDVGCGRGTFLKAVKNKFPRMQLIGADLNNYIKGNLDLEFINCIDLTDKGCCGMLSKYKTDICTCLDVLEHVPSVCLDQILLMLSKISEDVFIAVSNYSNIIDDYELHLIQMGEYWWRECLEKYFEIVTSEIYNSKSYFYHCRRK